MYAIFVSIAIVATFSQPICTQPSVECTPFTPVGNFEVTISATYSILIKDVFINCTSSESEYNESIKNNISSTINSRNKEHKGSFKIPENILLNRSNCSLDGEIIEVDYFGRQNIKSYCVVPECSFESSYYIIGRATASIAIVVRTNRPEYVGISCRVSTQNDTAIEGIDYEAINKSVEFETGQRSATVVITIINNNDAESIERFRVELTTVDPGILIKQGIAHINIIDDVTVTWRGIPVTGPALIFHDELASLGSDVLNCSHPTLSRVTWYSVDGIPVTDSMANNTGAFQQVRTPAGIFPSEAQLVSNGESSNDSSLNGLWTCQSNNTSAGAFSVGLYNRRGGHGAILSVTVTIASSSFTSDPPTFTLFGETNGGPPTNYTWTRNNVTITDSSSFRTSIMLNRTHDTQGYLIGSYRSTLTVTGRLPGIYQYSVSNRATLDMMTSNIIIEGDSPSNLTLHRVSINKVEVSWTEPVTGPLSNGYMIDTDVVLSSPYTITLNPVSQCQDITLVSNSSHYPIDDVVGSITLIKPTPNSPLLLNATSVNISWTQPQGVLIVDEYRVLVNQVDTGLCSDIYHAMNETSNSTSIILHNLEEFSTYTVSIIAMNKECNVINGTSGFNITTSPTEPPHKVKISKITSQSITVRWKSITCKKHNGVPVTYEVQFGPLGGVIMTKRITSRSFFSNGLTPSTSYIFRVCGYYGERHGPFSDFINITTLHERNPFLVYVTTISIVILLVVVIFTTASYLYYRLKKSSKRIQIHKVIAEFSMNATTDEELKIDFPSLGTLGKAESTESLFMKLEPYLSSYSTHEDNRVVQLDHLANLELKTKKCYELSDMKTSDIQANTQMKAYENDYFTNNEESFRPDNDSIQMAAVNNQYENIICTKDTFKHSEKENYNIVHLATELHLSSISDGANSDGYLYNLHSS